MIAEHLKVSRRKVDEARQAVRGRWPRPESRLQRWLLAAAIVATATASVLRLARHPARFGFYAVAIILILAVVVLEYHGR